MPDDSSIIRHQSRIICHRKLYQNTHRATTTKEFSWEIIAYLKTSYLSKLYLSQDFRSSKVHNVKHGKYTRKINKKFTHFFTLLNSIWKCTSELYCDVLRFLLRKASESASGLKLTND